MSPPPGKLINNNPPPPPPLENFLTAHLFPRFHDAPLAELAIHAHAVDGGLIRAKLDVVDLPLVPHPAKQTLLLKHVCGEGRGEQESETTNKKPSLLDDGDTIHTTCCLHYDVWGPHYGGVLN